MVRSFLQYFYYVLGEGLSKGIIFLTFSFFTGYFSKEDFGRLSLFWITIPLLSIFIDFAQRSFIKKKFLESPDDARNVIPLISLVSAGIALIYALVIFIFNYLGHYIIDKTFDRYLVVCSYSFVIIELGLSFFQMKGDVKYYNVFYFLRNSTPYIITFFIAYFLVDSIFEAVLFAQVQALVLLFSVFAIFYKLYKSTTFNYNLLVDKFKIRLIESFKFSLPIVPGILCALFLSFSDRYIINYYYSEIEVANYTVAYTVSSIFMAFFMATNKMWQKFILENLKAKNIYLISKTAKYYIAVVLFIGVMVIVCREFLVSLLSNPSYLLILDIVPTIIIGMFFYFLYTILSNIPFFYRNTFLMVLPAIVAASSNLILNFILIPIYGYKIAAMTTTCSYFIEFVLIYIICLQYYKVDILFKTTNELK